MASLLVLLQITSFIFMATICQAQTNLDPCFSNPCNINAICTSTYNMTGYICQCLDGFAGDGKNNCTEVCASNTCSNDWETCHTNPDYPSQSSNAYICKCDAPNYLSNGICCSQSCPQTTQQLNNSETSFPQCQQHCNFVAYVCPPGYVSYQNPPTCLEFSICQPYNPCGKNGRCKSHNNATYTCDCLPGYVVNENGTCVDINECNDGTPCDVTSSGTVCVNNPGGYNCSCDSNHTLAVKGSDSSPSCIALDDCSIDNGGCEQNCENSPAGPICSCVAHFIAKGAACEFDTLSGIVQCPDVQCNYSAEVQSGVCLNGTCSCFNGYALKDNMCAPNRSCADINSDCYFGFQCTNTNIGFTCNCNSTFRTGSDGRCYDFDECVVGEHDCDGNATCTNTAGGYQCQCNKGFSGNGTVCSELPSVCLESAVEMQCSMVGESCRLRSIGEPYCYCALPSALLGNPELGYVCSSLDSGVYIYQLSMELIGNYYEDSYENRRQLEQNLQQNLFPKILKVPVFNLEVVEYQLLAPSDIMISVNLLFNQDMSYLVDLMVGICSPYNFVANSCILPINFLTRSNSIQIIDITNSTICSNPGTCGENSVCEVLDHDYQCKCSNGYVVDGYSNIRKPNCVDKNECLSDICGSPTQMCINKPGNYTCECVPCYIWDSNHDDCLFICQNNPCQNNGFCQLTVTGNICSYGCTCGQDYFGPNCEMYNEALHVAKNDEAIIGGVLGGLLLIMVGISIFLVYKIYKWKGYFSIQAKKSQNKTT